MIQLTDFVSICRLCLRDHENQSVKLFSYQNIAAADDEGTRKIRVAEMVEPFCNVKIKKGDGLPECICNECWNTVSSMQKLQMVSCKSDRLLNDILDSQSSISEAVKVEPPDEISDFKIEFIDTQSNEEKLPLKRLSTRSKRKTKTIDLTEPETNNMKTKGKKIKKDKEKRKYVRGLEKKISCEICGSMVAYNTIEFHLNMHKDNRPYKCEMEECNKYFTSPNHVKQHFRKVHVYSITRPYVCDICGKGYVQSSSLVSHKSYHFDPQIPCPICGQLYRNKRALQRHSLVHSGERAFTCEICSKSFQTNFTLKTHMRIHTLEKPFPCSECSKAFAYKCLLKAHLEKHHPGVSL